MLPRTRAWLGLAVAVAAAAVILATREWSRSTPSVPKVVDDADLVPPDYVNFLTGYLDRLEYESGVDVRVRIVRDTHAQPMPRFALDLMRTQGIGKDVG